MAAFVVLTATLFVTSAWAASREKILHNFGDRGNDGILPSNGALIFDSAGNLYARLTLAEPEQLATKIAELYLS
jgi:hypothetical protein